MKVFFAVIGKHPQEVRPADVLAFVTAQRAGRASIGGVVEPVADEELAVSLPTVRRRLSSVSGLYAFLHARGDVPTNPVPRGLPTRRERQRPAEGCRCCIGCALLDVGPHRCQHDRSHGVCEVSSRHAGA